MENNRTQKLAALTVVTIILFGVVSLLIRIDTFWIFRYIIAIIGIITIYNYLFRIAKVILNED